MISIILFNSHEIDTTIRIEMVKLHIFCVFLGFPLIWFGPDIKGRRIFVSTDLERGILYPQVQPDSTV